MGEAAKKKPKVDPAVVHQAVALMSDIKAKLLLKQPFFGMLLSMTDFIVSVDIETMATDGVKIYFNPDFVIALTEPERHGVLLHEICHCIYLHLSPKRRMNREHKRWNVATDYAINEELVAFGNSLPSMALLGSKYRDKNAEQIYDELPQDIDHLETLDVHIEPSDGSTDWDDMEDRVITAYEMTKDFYDGKTHGKFPGGIERWIAKIRKSKVKWERIFHKYVGEAVAHDDFSYARCNRRMMAQDIYLPSMHNHVIGNIVVAVDTSGSITKDIIEKFVAEMVKLSHLVQEITVITCDAAVHEVVKLNQLGDILKKVKFLGGGGTDFRPAFDVVAKQKLSPELFIYLTDLFGSFPEKPPQYPVIWCVVDNEDPVAPFGQCVVIPKVHNI